MVLAKRQFSKSESYFRTAIATATQRNPNPYDSEPYYNLGLSLSFQNKVDDAYNAFFKAAWSSAWQDGAYFSVAQIDIQRKDYSRALEHINWSLDRNARNGKAYLLKIHALRKLKRINEAIYVADVALKRDNFNLSALYELYNCYVDLDDESKTDELFSRFLLIGRGNAHTLIDFAIEYAALGLYKDAAELLLCADTKGSDDAMLNYYIGHYWCKGGIRIRVLLICKMRQPNI